MSRIVHYTIMVTCASALLAGVEGGAAEIPARIDLEVATSLALEHNYAIRQARARYVEAAGGLLEARAGRLPTVAASAGYSEIDRGLLEGFGAPRNWNAGIEGRQTLYAGGAIKAGVLANEAAEAAAAAGFDASVQGTLLAVKRAFLAVLLAREQVQVQQENIKLLEEELATTRARVEAGTGSPFEQLRAEVALANGQPVLLRARNTYRLAAVELLQIVGLPAEEGIEDRIVGRLAYAPREFTLESLLGSARLNRAEVRQLEYIVAASEQAMEGARSGLRPRVALAGGYGIQKSALSRHLDDTVDGWTVGLQGSWPIFDGRATKGRVAQARSRVDQARLGLDETLLAIEAEVRQAFLSYGNARELVNASQKVVGQAEESLRLARARFSAGAATQLDVLQAQVALTQARSNEAQALHDAALALALLERAAGLTVVPETVRLGESAQQPVGP